jgi:hypothetical protein
MGETIGKNLWPSKLEDFMFMIGMTDMKIELLKLERIVFGVFRKTLRQYVIIF